MTETARRLGRLGRPHARARMVAVTLAGAGLALGRVHRRDRGIPLHRYARSDAEGPRLGPHLGAMAQRLERVLTTDPGMGVIRHADAGYDTAIDFAAAHGIDRAT